jgi:hypothetical protein
MTKEEYSNLPSDEQEEFINNGGIISVVAPSQGVIISPLVEVKEVAPPQPEPQERAVEVPSSPLQHDTFTDEREKGFDISDPVELLFLLDDDIKSGLVTLHPWQIEYMLDFAAGGQSDDHPFQSIVRACNGSGKDKYVIAACIVWLCMRYKLSRGVITSSSGVQLDNQTDVYIEQLCKAANKKFADGREEIWKCNYRYYYCLITESPILLFATDEAGKAEGYHPLGSGRKMALFESEAKSVPDDIYVAMSRCTGYTHRALVSTPGLPLGHFYDIDRTSVDRRQISSVYDIKPIDWILYHITAYDCPHIKKNAIEMDKRDLPGGEHGAAFKSKILAEFGTTDEMVVIPYIYIQKSIDNKIPWISEPYNKGGLDLSDGGAETVLVVRNGNKLLKVIPFRFDNTEDTINFLEEKFTENNLRHKDAIVNADCCGIGKPMINALKRRGWANMRFIDSRSAASEKRTYKNRGTELFFHVRALMEHRELIIYRDDQLIKQLAGRYYKMDINNVHCLLTKLEQRSHGYHSPDRADAFNLAFWDYKSTYSYDVKELPFDAAPETTNKVVGDFDLKSWAYGTNEERRPYQNPVKKMKEQDFEDLQDEIRQINNQRRGNLVLS